MNVTGAPPPLIEVGGLGKSYPGVQALCDVSLSLDAGEVLAVIGENGAGKSTLMKILAGNQRRDEGVIRVDGREVVVDSVQDAMALGVTLIHQELNICDNLSVGAWTYLGREPRRGPFMDEEAIRQGCREQLERLGTDIVPSQRMDTLSIGQQQMVEIAKALAVGARVLIMDEPTSSLSQEEANHLFGVVDELRNSGVGIIYISHRLSEVERLADRVNVLRDGRLVGELSGNEISHDRMVSLMIGRDLPSRSTSRDRVTDDPLLEVRGLRTSAHPDKLIDMTLNRGEIIGLAGLVGSGRTELLRGLVGIDPRPGGIVVVDGNLLQAGDLRASVSLGVALVPEDRKNQGVILDSSIEENIALPNLGQVNSAGWVDQNSLRALTLATMEKLSISPANPEHPAGNLSGGNQQKVALGKWLTLELKLLLLDEPTRGIDVGAKVEVYNLMEDMANRGMTILFASNELDEILRLSDRVIVMHQGRISGTVDGSEADEERIMQLATGRSRVA